MIELSSVAAALLVLGVATVHAATKVSKADFGKTADGTAVQIFTLTNEHGLEARISTYGGAVVSLKTPDLTGQMADIVQGFDTVEGYLNPAEPYFGALIGRYGNRIGHAQFTLDGKVYHLSQRRRQHFARRSQGLRQGGVDSAPTARWRTRAHLSE